MRHNIKTLDKFIEEQYGMVGPTKRDSLRKDMKHFCIVEKWIFKFKNILSIFLSKISYFLEFKIHMVM